MNGTVRTMPGPASRYALPPDWKPYVYRGSQRERRPGAAGPGRGARNWGHLPPTWHPSCGRPAGKWAHRKRGEKPCEACREAYNATRRKGTPKGRPRRSECGSEAGYRRHLVEGTLVCDQCREAVNAANRDRYTTPRCRACGYFKSAPGHKIECGGDMS
jgi:hypothetical protein